MVGKLVLTISVALIGIILLSGCTQPPTGQVGLATDSDLYKCSSGDLVSNLDLCPEEVEQNIVPSPVEKQIEVKVAVFSERDNSPIAKATIYVDGENKCITESDGTCSFFAEPNNYTFRIQGEGIFSEEIKNISDSFSSPIFKVGRKITTKITVLDELTTKGVGGIDVYLNGSLQGKTETNGVLSIHLLDEGSYVLEVKKEQSSNSKTIQVNSDAKEFSITIQTPRNVTIKIIDSEVKKPIDDAKVFLDGTEVGRTIQTGEVIVENIIPKDYTLSLEQLSFASYGFTGSSPSTRVRVGNEKYITAEVDMPNPIFEVSINCEQWWAVHEYGHCTVTIKNLGKINSRFTNAQVLLYPICQGEYLPNPANQLSLDFGTISPGLSKELTTIDTDSGFDWGCDTDAVVIIKDGWDYTPENTQIIGMQSSLLTQWIVEAKDWCSSNAESCANVAGVFIGTAIKAAGYGGSSN